MQRFDLNLLVVLDALLENCSVSKAALALNVSPPAISKSLNRIRELFNDKLLVRSGNNLILTPRALQLKPQIRHAIDIIEVIFKVTPHCQLASPHKFVIAANDVLRSKINHHWSAISQDSELVVEFTRQEHDADFLRKNSADLYLGEIREFPPETMVRTLCHEQSVIITRRSNQQLSAQTSLDELAAYRFVTINDTLNKDIDAFFIRQGLERRISAVGLNYFSLIEEVMLNNALAIVPDSFSQVIKRLNLDIKAIESSLQLPTMTLIQAWHPKYNNFTAHKRLRDIICELFARP
jgi:DNA-binding transcriptional LysR family regulator